jgi:hypothetical protein
MASVAEIDGLTVPSAAAFLLDTYTGAAAGYSVRRIASSATNLMRIREDSGDTETDIGYDSNGDLDTAAIAFHCGTANGFVVTWYDQSGNGNDATQPTAGGSALQPQIYNGTSVITENGKPALQYDGSDDFLTVPNDKASFKFMHDGSFATIEGVARFGNSSNPDAAYTLFDTGGLSSTLRGASLAYDDRSAFSRNNQINLIVSRAVSGDSNRPVFIQTNDKITPNQQTLVYATIDADNATADDRGKYAISGGTLFGGNTNTVTPVTTDSDGDLHLGRYSQSNILQLLGTMQELVLWDADHSGSRTAIESDINGFFGIY